MKTMNKGFTLIELMIVIAIVAILAAIALPAYQDYTVRAKISEALLAADAVKVAVAEGFDNNDIAGVNAVSDQIALDPPKSKFVDTLTVTKDTGVIVVTTAASSATSGLPSDAIGKTINLSPYVTVAGAPKPLATGLSGVIDWACTTILSTTADSRLLTGAALGTLPTKYAPTECK